jgi:hypothetical protein
MKVFYLWVCLFCISTGSMAQTIFDGKLIVKGSGFYSYKLVLTIDSINNLVTGYSITDEKGKEETKTLLKGTYSAKQKKIKIAEYEIVQTKAKAKDVVFCFIEAELKITKAENDSVLVGQFTGKLFPKQDLCGTGGIAVKQVHPKSKKVKKTISEIPGSIVIPEPKKEEKVDLVAFDLVTSNTILAWNSDSVIIELWDQGNQDNDSVSVFYDGKLIESNIKLGKTKIRYRLPVSKGGEHIVSVLAENEGFYPPNTAAMILYDGKKKYSLMCQSKLNEMKTIRVKR